MSVSAIIPTRGDVDLEPIWENLPSSWERIVWDNSAEDEDLAVAGRYAAITRASSPIIYTQDDDVVVAGAEQILRVYLGLDTFILSRTYQRVPVLVANMPLRFRANYPDSALVGLGAVFHRDTPRTLFERFWATDPDLPMDVFYRTCDVVFSTLAKRHLVDVPEQSFDYAFGRGRMYRRPEHTRERRRTLELARIARARCS